MSRPTNSSVGPKLSRIVTSRGRSVVSDLALISTLLSSSSFDSWSVLANVGTSVPKSFLPL
jgi:hypothetical protein